MARQNRSSAVMQQRHEALDSIDDFPTPPWATRALCEYLKNEVGYDLSKMSVREPAANRGYMVKPLSEYFRRVVASDCHDYGVGFAVRDYLIPRKMAKTDFTITNPPFVLAEQFIHKMSANSRVGFAVLVRSAFTEGGERYDNIFSKNPPSYVLQFVERVAMFRNRLIQSGAKYYDEDGQQKTASSATAYSWLVWIDGEHPTKFDWIVPCRLRLEREGDYPPIEQNYEPFGLFEAAQ